MPEEFDHIEELQKRLNARDPDSVPKQKFGILHPVKQNVESTWGEKNLPDDTTPQKANVKGYKRVFLFSVIFFAVGLGLAAFSVFRGAVTLSSKNVDLTILGSSFVAGGEELPIQVEIANRNSSDLVDATLTLEYPKGAVDGTGSEIARSMETLGTISSGKTKSIAFSAVLYGEQGLSRTITATLSYHLAGSTATFEKSQSFSVLISSSPIELTVDGPSVTSVDQPFALTIRSLFSGDQSLENPLVRVEYPNGFTFISADPAPSRGTNVWSLGTLEKGTERTVTVRGRISGIEGDEKAFRIYLGMPTSDTDSRIAVSYNSVLHSVLLERPFIAAALSVGERSGDITALPLGSDVSGSISWRNMTGMTITMPTFTLLLEGEGIDFNSVNAVDGYYDELLHLLTWTATSSDKLATIDPEETGELLFSFSPKTEVSTDDFALSLSVQGTIPDNQNEIKSISNLDALTIRFASRIQFAANALYSTGPIKNSGPYPPKANQETSYTITWTARPAENPQTAVVASATLPPNVTWAGVIMPQSESISYNPDSREIRWNVGSLPKATATPLSKSVSFQVRMRPTISQVNTEPVLLSETKITATDATANVPLSALRPELTTRLSTDPSYSPGQEKVLP